ncbi:hypothetical protein BBG47_27010 [Paenibacillus sp. KS1]|nr:hypothetical protein BBG47_27010 [Paenibacillus sp. KS1]
MKYDRWKESEDYKLNRQRRKVKRAFIVFLILLLVILISFITLGLNFTKNIFRDLCGITNC